MAYVRLLVGAELLASDFYAQAIAASTTTGAVTKYLKRAYLNEQEHYQSVAGISGAALSAPAVSGDLDFSYPSGYVRRPRRRSSKQRRRSRRWSSAHTSAPSAG